MTVSGKTNISVIKQRDTSVPEHLDFAFLREKGLEHIGNFAGRIWTDHNTHDPGITTLEALCYAILDLGYRTQLPIEDLLAKEHPEGKDNNFFSPAEILSCNPVTIVDYRKLLMEIEGVRNAWLEPYDGYSFYPRQIRKSTSKSKETKTIEDDCVHKIQLNGLYRVYLELEPGLLPENDPQERQEETKQKIRGKVKEILSAHRNLCEDFESVTILSSQRLAVFAEVEVLPGVNPNEIYAEILRRLRDFIAPSVRFYTLQGMLERGKSIEEIYAGRPLLLNPDSALEGQPRLLSYGFIDTEELEQIPLRREIHISDLYTEIHNIEGVRTVRNLNIRNQEGGSEKGCYSSEPGCKDEISWRFHLAKDHLPYLDIESSEIELNNFSGKLVVDETRIKEQVTGYLKSRKTDPFLDARPPMGMYRSDLSDYTSIQNEFPRVYGIGEVGLPEEAPLLRKAQASQLQAYLLFFDQLLADYLNQLGNLREVFSLERESLRDAGKKHIYFSKPLNAKDVPGLNELVRFQVGKNKGITEGHAFSVPVSADDLKRTLPEIEARFNKTLALETFGNCRREDLANSVEVRQIAFKYRNVRDAAIDQIRRDLERKHFKTDIRLDLTGYYFILWPQSTPDIAIVGNIHFKLEKEAVEAANLAAFFGAWNDNWTQLNDQSAAEDRYSMHVTYRSIDYTDFLNKLAEGDSVYLERREMFLEHLLSRFSEKFTEFASLNYYLSETDEGRKKRSIEYQSHFLSGYDEISKNRGKGFDYLKPTWESGNISGLEKRASLLGGYGQGLRKNLCNIEVVGNKNLYRVQLQDWRSGKTLLQSEKPLPSEAIAREVALSLRNSLKQAPGFKEGYNAMDSHYTLSLRVSGVPFSYPQVRELTSQSVVQEKARYINSLVSITGTQDNIEVSSYEYRHELWDAAGALFGSGKDAYPSLEEAQKFSGAFIKEIQSSKKGNPPSKGLSLLELEKDKRYLNIADLNGGIFTLPLKWFWEKPGQAAWEGGRFLSQQEAALHFIEHNDLSKILVPYDKSYLWRMDAGDNIVMSGNTLFPDDNRALTDWKLAKEFGTVKKQYLLRKEGTTIEKIELLNASGTVIAQTGKLELAVDMADKAVSTLVNYFKRATFQPEITDAGPAWAFRVFEKEDTVLVNSYRLYGTKLEALWDLLETFTLGKDAKNYVLEGGTPLNPEFVFLLTHPDKGFIAESPAPFPEKEARDEARKHALKVFKKLPPPVIFRAEPQTYTFRVGSKNGEIVLTGAAEYPSDGEAHAALLAMLPGLSDPATVTVEKVDKNIVVRSATGVSAVLENPKDKEVAKTLNRLATELKEAVFALEIRKSPKSWRFVHFWETETGALAPVFKSVKEDFSSESDAKSAYDNFLSNLKHYKRKGRTEKIPVFTIPEHETSSFTLYGSADQPLPDVPVVLNFLKFYRSVDVPDADQNDPWVQPIGQQEGFRYQLINKGNPFAYHRSWLKSCKPVKENTDDPCKDEQIKEAIKQLNIGEPCIDQLVEIEQFFEGEDWIPNSSPEDITRKEKKGQKTIKDCYFKNRDEACLVRDRLESHDQGGNRWLEICATVPGIVQLPTGERDICKYHYVVKGNLKDELPKEINLLISTQGYDTKDLAIDAFKKQLWGLVETASNPENYGNKICLENCRDLKPDECGRTQEFEAALHEDFMPDNPLSERTKTLARLFKSFPIRYHKEIKKFYFQLFEFQALAEESDPIPDWTSWQCYDTYEAAYNAFLRLFDLLNNKSNIRVVCRGGKYRVELEEVLVRSTRTYKNKDGAWGRTEKYGLLNNVESDSPCPERPNPCSEYGAELFLKSAQEKYAFIPTANEQAKPTVYGFKVVNNCYYVASHPCWYETKEEAEKAYKNLMDHLEDFKVVVREDKTGLYGELEPKKPAEIPAGREPCGCGEKKDQPFVCPRPLKIHMTGSFLTKEQEAAKKAEEVWADIQRKGKFTMQVVEESSCGPYSFQLIDECCILAENPTGFGTTSRRDEAMECAKALVQQEGMHLMEHILLRRPLKKFTDKSDYRDDKKTATSAHSEDNTESCYLNGCPDCECDLCWVEDPFEQDPCVLDENRPIPYIPFADAYSFWGTVVLPGWLNRFASRDSRDIFEKLLYLESPSHVALNILWLSPREMSEFELCYRAWLSQQTCEPDASSGQTVWCDTEGLPKTPCDQPDSGEVDCNIVICLKSLRGFSFCKDETARTYNRRMLERITDIETLCGPLGGNELFEQAKFFLNTEARPKEYQNLIEKIDKEALNFQGRNNPHAKMAAIVTAHFFDKALERSDSQEIPLAVKEVVPFLQTLKNKGLANRAFINSWKGGELSAIHHRETISQIKNIIK